METQAMSLGVSLADFQAASARRSPSPGDTTANINVSLHGTTGFDITFDKSLGNVDQVVAQVIPLLRRRRRRHRPLPRRVAVRGHVLDGGEDTRQRERQPQRDHPRAVHPERRRRAHRHHARPAGCDGTTVDGNDEKQLVTLTNATGGTFQLVFNGQLTTPIAWDAPANSRPRQSSSTPLGDRQADEQSTIGAERRVTKCDATRTRSSSSEVLGERRRSRC